MDKSFNQTLAKQLRVIGLKHTSNKSTTRSSPKQKAELTLSEKGNIWRWTAVDSLKKSRSISQGRSPHNTWEFELLPVNRIIQYLTKIDEKLTPLATRGLRIVADGNVENLVAPIQSGRILVLVHGTFSRSDRLVNGLYKKQDGSNNVFGQNFMQWAQKEYDQVLAFGHPTISVSPILNAMDLERCLGQTKAQVDIIAHSRGGLVARWWRDCINRFSERCGNTVFVGSPLAGTSLAAPGQIKNVLDYFTNLINMAWLTSQTMAIFMPFLQGIASVFRVFHSLISFTAKSKIPDAFIALVPGFFSMSASSNNLELEMARAIRNQFPDKYFSIQSNFVPQAAGWKFWRHFQKKNVAKRMARAVFPFANDLVVDTQSMTDFGQFRRSDDIFDFGASSKVHHTNYFEQQETADSMTSWLSDSKTL